jgi:hypothetical protein
MKKKTALMCLLVILFIGFSLSMALAGGTDNTQPQSKSSLETADKVMNTPPRIRTPITLNFPDVYVGEELVMGVEIYNDGQTILTVNSIIPQFADNVSRYFGPSTPFDILGPGWYKTVNVSFAPNAVGPFTRVYNVNSNDPDNPTVPLTIKGNGIPRVPDIALSSNSWSYATTVYGDCKTGGPDIYNHGTETLRIDRIERAPGGSQWFNYATPTTPFYIPAGGTQKIDIKYCPLDGVSHSAVFVIYSNDPDEPEVTVNVSGQARPGPRIRTPVQNIVFDPTKVGTSQDKTTVFYNDGDLTLTINKIEDDSGSFAHISPGTPFDIGVGQSSNITVRFTPQSEGSLQTTFTINSNDRLKPQVTFEASGFGKGDPDIRIPPDDVDCGETTVGTSSAGTLSIYNDGTDTLLINSIEKASGSNEFCCPNPIPPFSIAPGGQEVITMTFSPESIGEKRATFTINSNDPDEPAVTFDIVGIGTEKPLPEIIIKQDGIIIPNGDIFDFGSHKVDTTIDKPFIIENKGTADLTLMGSSIISIAGTNKDQFGVQQQPATPVKPGYSTSFKICFAPNSEGVKTASISITSNDTGSSPYIINFKGTATVDPPFVEITNPKNDETVSGEVNIQANASSGKGVKYVQFLIQEVVKSSDDSAPYSYLWNTTGGNNGRYTIMAVVYDNADQTASHSIEVIVNNEENITVTSPDGGEEWKVGFQYDITWISTDNVGNVKIEYSVNNGINWKPVESSIPNSKTYRWTVPDDISSQCLVKVNETDGSPSDTSNTVFSIVPANAPTITVNSPNGGEEWRVGTPQEITWTWSGAVGNVNIEYSIDDGSGWFTIASNTANSGKHPWTIPDKVSSSCLVRVSETDGSPTDRSNAVFSIIPEGTDLYFNTGIYNIANTSSIANEFTLWMDVTDEKGNEVDLSGYGVRIVEESDSNRVFADMKSSPGQVADNNIRWYVAFRINGTNTPSFENGLVQIYDLNNSTLSYTKPSTELLLSVYGTEFDMGKHSYFFKNGNWNKPHITFLWWEDNFFKACEVIDNYICPLFILPFWASVGFHLDMVDLTIDAWGLCYGMTNSAIANFTYRNNEMNAWGEAEGNTYSYWYGENLNSWRAAIDARWPLLSTGPYSPHKPYRFNDLYTGTYDTKNKTWTLEACKKIVYYFVTQPAFYWIGWPGSDTHESATFENMKELLESGNPISLSLPGIKHTVAITQMIRWNKKLKLAIYDSDRPLDISGDFGSFSEINFADYNSVSFKKQKLEKINSETGESLPYGKELKEGKIVTLEGDSQRIYNHSDRRISSNSDFMAGESYPATSRQKNAVRRYYRFLSTSNYIDITAIGAETFNVYDNETNTKISLVKNGQLNGNQAVYIHEQGTILTKIYLPSETGKVYRVEMIKNSRIPRLKIFANVPKDSNQIEVTGYDNVHKSMDDSTKVVFLVGRENSDHTLERTSDSNETDQVNPDFVEEYAGPPEDPELSINRKQLYFGAAGSDSTFQPIFIENKGTGTLSWSAKADKDWISFSPSSGTDSDVLIVTVNANGLPPGIYNGIIKVSASNAANSPQNIHVTLMVYNPGSTSEPFGDFATPVDNSTVRSSIPVTGWVLDDIGVESVKIYRGEPGNLVYIGDAVFVEGARPDVERAYTGYPLNYKAGWGYMMLTNFLPNGGNGAFKIHAIATDTEGNQVTLGTKRIICDNANAVKPFGAIDTPTQGGTTSGSSFVNWGWILTPQPNHIPANGSSIDVYVDGVKIGHPTYNLYRADIAALFPGYANSNGAVGYFYLDTTAYANGVHTIQWTAKDSAGNRDGIGSRYFTIQNTGDSRAQDVKISAQCAGSLEGKDDSMWSPGSQATPVKIKKGFNRDVEPRIANPDENGNITIEIKELEPLEIHLSLKNALSVQYNAYMAVGRQLKPLPIGSTLDVERGVFFWQPGPGFLGEYEFIFITTDSTRKYVKKKIRVRIKPKF